MKPRAFIQIVDEWALSGGDGLAELGAAHAVPARFHEPDFAAMREMATWLAHPQEMGRPPDQVAVQDSRELFWPPTGDRRRLWLIRYHYADDGKGQPETGLGCVGSVTFALFGQNDPRTLEQIMYGRHCLFEMQRFNAPQTPVDWSAENALRVYNEELLQ